MVDSPTDSNDGLESDHGCPSGDEIEPTVLFPARKTKIETATNRKKYTEMIVIALYHLNERGGTSRQALVKYIKGNFEVAEKRVNRCFVLAMAKLEEEEQVIRKSGIGANGRFSLSKTARECFATGKKPKKKTASKTKASAVGKKKAGKKGEGDVDKADDDEGDESSDKENIEKPVKKTSKTKNKDGGKVEQAAKTKKANDGASSGNAGTKKPAKVAKGKEVDSKASKAPGTKKVVAKATKGRKAVKDGEEETGQKKTTSKASKKDKGADKNDKAAGKKTSKETVKGNKQSKTTKEKTQK